MVYENTHALLKAASVIRGGIHRRDGTGPERFYVRGKPWYVEKRKGTLRSFECAGNGIKV